MMDYYSRPRWLARQARQLVYPRRCPFCGRVLGLVPECADCAIELEALRRRPSMRLNPAAHYLGALQGAAAPYQYAGCARRAILSAKYHAAPWVAVELGTQLAQLAFGSELSQRGSEPTPCLVEGLAAGYDCIVPVPASSRRRGYNVPQRMALPLARAVGVPLEADLLARVRTGRKQEGLSLDERLANVAGAFRATDPARVEGRRVLLVDDVITTGATAAACAQALLAAGAQSVFAVAFATVEWDAAPPRDVPVHENADEDGPEL